MSEAPHIAAWRENRRDLRGASWLVGARFIAIVLGIVGVSLTIRHLGKADYGVLAFAYTLVQIVAAAGRLGLDGPVVREIVRRPWDTGAIVGTAAGMRLMAAVLASAAVLAIGMRVGLTATADWRLMAVAAIVLPVSTLDVFDFVCVAQRRLSIKALTGVLSAAMRVGWIVGCVLTAAPLWVFAFALGLEALVRGVALAAGLRRPLREARPIRFALDRVWALLRLSLPLAGSAVLAMIYLQIDRLMIGTMLGAGELGEYAIVARLGEGFVFLGGALSQAVSPRFLRLAQRDEPTFHARLEEFGSLLCGTAYAIAIVTVALAGPLLLLIGGDQVSDTAVVALRVHAFATVFVFVGRMRGIWVLHSGRTELNLLGNVLGAAVNIGLNWLLLPVMGIVGASLATLISYAVAFILATALLPEARPLVRHQMRALLMLRFAAATRHLRKPPHPPKG